MWLGTPKKGGFTPPTAPAEPQRLYYRGGEAFTDPGMADPGAYLDGRCGDVPRSNRNPYDDGRG